MKTTLFFLTLALSSCGVGNYVDTNVGYYTPSTPLDPSAVFGAFVSKATLKVIPTK